MAAIILAALALVVAVVALVIAMKKQTVKVEKEIQTVVEHTPVENPFYFDKETGAYTLDSNLSVTGFISCLGINNQL